MTLPISGQMGLQDLFEEFHSSDDPLWPNVASSISFDGTPGATTFTDNLGFDWTPTGNPILSTSQKLYGNTSLYLDGSSYLSIVDGVSPNVEWRSAEFTIEFWVYPTSESGRQVILSLGSITRVCCDGTSLIFERTTDIITFTDGLNLNQWNYVLIYRLANAQLICMTSNGYGPSSQGFNADFASGDTRIGARPDGTQGFTGYLYDLRLTGRFARYAAPAIPRSPLSYNLVAPPLSETGLIDYYRGGGLVSDSPSNSNIPAGGQISLSDFYGAENSPTTIQPTGCHLQFPNGASNISVGISDQVDSLDQTVLVAVMGVGSSTLSYNGPSGWDLTVSTRNGRAGLFVWTKWFDKNVDPTTLTWSRTAGTSAPTVLWLLSIPYSYDGGFEVVVPSITEGNVGSISYPSVTAERKGDMPLYLTSRCAANFVVSGTPTISAVGEIDGISREMGAFTGVAANNPGCSTGIASFPLFLAEQGAVFENVVISQANDDTSTNREWQACCILFHHKNYQP